MSTPELRFSFGRNWLHYLNELSEEAIESASRDLEYWLSQKDIVDKRIVDIGCGSGVHSLAFHRAGAAELLSFDYDPDSVEATASLHEKAGSPGNWKIVRGSVLDAGFLRGLGKFDVVYSWGVLHHSGDMWRALDNAAQLVRPGGVFFVSLYAKGSGSRYEKDLAAKKRFNRMPLLGRRLMVARHVAKLMWQRLKRFRNPFGWNERVGRGMDRYHDIVDWLGGLPYEVASEDEMLQFAKPRNLILERLRVSAQRGCSVFVFRYSPESD